MTLEKLIDALKEVNSLDKEILVIYLVKIKEYQDDIERNLKQCMDILRLIPVSFTDAGPGYIDAVKKWAKQQLPRESGIYKVKWGNSEKPSLAEYDADIKRWTMFGTEVNYTEDVLGWIADEPIDMGKI